MDEEEMVTITREEYDELKATEKFMDCLDAAGVDNWDGYGFAQEMMLD